MAGRRRSGVEAAVERGAVRLAMWGAHFDEFIVLSEKEARHLAAQLLDCANEIAGRAGVNDK